jgi:hypothetical protein
MDTAIPYLRSQDSLYAEIKVLMRDSGPTRWTAAEYYTALNQVLMTWADKVKFERVYTITDGWQAGTFEYTVPSYVRPPVFAEQLRRIPHDDYGLINPTTTRWQPVQGWELVANTTGGQAIRLYAPPRTMEGRVVWYAPNSRVPTTVPTSSGSTAADATTMLLGSAVDIDEVGIVKCESEYIGYAGVDRGSATTTLNNLARGLNGSAAATHAGSSSVYWCVAMDDMRLMRLLFDQWRSALHAYFIQDGGVHETQRHEKGMGYYDSLAMNFWPTYRPTRRTHDLVLNQRSYLLR